MNTQVIDNIVNEIKNLPEDKIPSLLDFLHFLKLDKDSYLSKEEKIIEVDVGNRGHGNSIS